MGLAVWLVFGVFAAMFVRTLMPGPDRLGILGDLTLGAVAATIGGAVGMALGNVGFMEFDFRSMLTAMIACIATLFVSKAFALRGPA